MDKNERVMVVFTSQCSPYQAGERAAFYPVAAKKLVSEGVAKYADDYDAETEEVVEESDNADEQTNDDAGRKKKRSGKGAGKGKKGKSSDKPAGKRKRVKAG